MNCNDAVARPPRESQRSRTARGAAPAGAAWLPPRARARAEAPSSPRTMRLVPGPRYAVLCAEARSIRPGSVHLRASHVGVASRRDAGRRLRSRGRVGDTQARSGSGSSLWHRSVGPIVACSLHRLGERRDYLIARLLRAGVASASFGGARHRPRLRMIKIAPEPSSEVVMASAKLWTRFRDRQKRSGALFAPQQKDALHQQRARWRISARSGDQHASANSERWAKEKAAFEE